MKPVTDPTLLEQLNGGQSGLKPVQDPDLLAQLNGEPKEQSTWDKVKQAVKGQKEFNDAVSYEEWQWSQPRFGFGMPSIKTTMAGMFGSDADKLKSFQKNYNKDVKFDKYQNPYFEDSGKKVYIDAPGLDAGDVADFIGEAGTYVAGGVATAPIKGLGKRAAATGLVEAGVNVGNQKLAGRDEINKTEAAIAGLGGGAFELASPLVSAIFRKVKGLKTSNKTAGRVVAEELGIDLTNEQMERLGKYAKNVDFDQVDKAHLARMVEFDQIPTRGTALKDQNLMDYEKGLRNKGGYAAKRLEQIDQSNEAGLSRAMERLQSGRNVDDFQAADSVLDNVRKAERAAKKATGEAYDSVGNAYASTEPFRQAPQRIKRALSENNIILDPDNVPKTNVALKDIQTGIEKLGDSKAVSWGAVEQQRKRLNGLFSGASPEDKRALTVLKKQYDDTAFDAFENALFSGDPDVVKKLSEARGLATEYFRNYTKQGKYDNAGGVVEKWLNSDVAPEQVADAVINIHGNFKVNSPQMAKRYFDIVGGKDTPAGQDFKDMVVMRMTKKLGEPKTRNSLRTSLRKSLSGNKTIMDEVFTKKEQGFLSRALQYLDDTSLTGDKARTSGTTERLMRWMNDAGESDISLTGAWDAIKRTIAATTGARNRQFRLPTQQINTPALPAAGAMSADQSLNQ